MDLTTSIEPRSDQVNADDLVGGPITYTIREVIAGKAESPFDFMLVETDRAYRPSKTMRRVIVNAWGPEASAYAGRRLTLYREPSIKFGGAVVGGIRISHMSHIDGPRSVRVQVTRGKREEFTVEPLPDDAPTSQPAAVDLTGLTNAFNAAGITEREARLAKVQAVLGREVKSPAELNAEEVRQVIDAVQADLQQPFPPDTHPADDIAAQPEVATP